MFNVRSNSMVKSNKKFRPIIVTAIMSVIFLLSALLFIVPASEAPTAHAATIVKDRVTPLELMSVHNVDWVMGPLATKAATGANAGKYVDSDGNVCKDYENFDTNNVYGIPAHQYFNINSYLYTTTLNGQKILRGWQNGIQKVIPGVANAGITEDGYMESDPDSLGIYVDEKITASENKYMLIMPDDITQIGSGSGAFDGTTSTGGGSSTSTGMGTAEGNSYDEFTDFAFYVWSGENKYTSFTSLHTNYWSPRERLAGVYFNSTSLLNAITDRKDPAGGYRLNLSGKSAFAGCNNMKFFILPDNGLFTKIGNYAFCNLEQLRDLNIPASVTSIGEGALKNCANIPHLTIPSSVNTVGSDAFAGMSKLSDVENYSSEVNEDSFQWKDDKNVTQYSKLLNYYEEENGSQLYVVGNDENDTGANGYYFCKNVQGYSGTLATITTGGPSESYKANNWYVVALAGKDDTTATVVRRFPKQVTPDDPRRSKILYDYLNSDGKKCTNTLSETITKYDIGNGMADSTWCCNAVLPTCVEIIGDNAFHYSHTQYLEMSATTVGTDAFSSNNAEIQGTQENYYIHKAITKYGNKVFDGGSATSAVTRRFIFEDRSIYSTYVNTSGESAGTWKTDNVFDTNAMKNVRLYQIPIVANVVSADGDVNIIEGDIDTRFDYDADYDTRKSVTGADANGNGTYKITYTKRLSGADFNTVKQANGTWTTLTSTDHAKPTIEDMEKTLWYTDTNYATTTDAADRYTDTATSSVTATSVNIYTKKIARPGITDTEYTYGDDNIPSANIDLLEFDNPADKADYVATIKSFTYASETPAASAPTSVSNAGTYTVAISLDTEKWGAWTDDYQKSFTGTVVINRKPIDLGDLKNLPTFSADGVDLGGDGAGAALYHYDSGWYLYSQGDGQIGDTVYANNAYTRYTAQQKRITYPDDWGMYNINQSTGDHIATASRDYYATFNLSVFFIDGTNGETNFEFVYDSESENASLLSLYGLTLDNKKKATASLRKTWYIVMQSNWFIDSEQTLDATNPYNTPPYALALNSDNNSVRTWTYEDVLDIRMPKLAYNRDYSTGSEVTVSPSFSVYYEGAQIIKDESDLTKLKYYINPSMPAGTYSIVVSAPEILGRNEEGQDQTYPAISDSIQIVVMPKAMDTDDLQAALYNDGNTYEFPYDTNMHLYYKEGDDGFVVGSGVEHELVELNKLLNVKLDAANAEDSYWATDEGKAYFGVAQLTYNRDSLGTSNYSAYGNVAPMNVGQYTVYYCISAKNYITVGGENDANRRDKAFYTLIYNEILVSSLFGSQNDSAEYLQNLIYDGTPRYTSVPYNQLYRSEYTDPDYVNAHKDATVTVTLLDPVTSRWKYDLTDAAQTSRVPQPGDDDKAVIVAKYNILPAQNGWAVSPQMPSWSFNGFDSGINVVASGLQFTGADVMYRLGLLDEDSEKTTWTHYFKVNANGVVISGSTDGVNFDMSQTDIISELNLLKPGNYYLQSKVADIKVGDSVNVTGGEFVAQSNDGGMLATVNISKATNRWTRSPNIVRWTWSEYRSSRHVISSTALYPSLLSSFFGNGIYTPVAEYQIWKYVDEGNGAYSYERIEGLSILDGKDFWFTAVNEDIAAILGGLDAGDYVLRARLNGNEYYSDIEEQDSIFDIARATNSWKYSPNVVRWDWSNYNSAINVITATPVNLPEGAAVHYTILKSDYTLADNALRNFTEVTATIAGVLGGLPAGDYYLVAALEGTDNYLAINDWDTITEQEKSEEYAFGSVYDFADAEFNKQLAPIQFSIGKINNTWEITPGMTGWQYKNFTESNFIAGTPTNTPTGERVRYTVTKPDNGTFDLEYSVNEQTGKVVLSETTVAQLKALGVGTYQLHATLNGTDNYSSLNYPTTFTVIKATNTWERDPGMTSWSYMAFTVEGNFTAGIATLREDTDAVVTYKITKAGDSTPAITFTDIDDEEVESALKGLAVGSYIMTATYPETTDYDELTRTNITFDVTIIKNTWATSPVLTGWVYEAFTLGNFTAGVPTFTDSFDQDKQSAKVTYTITKNDGGITPIVFTEISDDQGSAGYSAFTQLNALGYGNYTMTVTYPGTTNYEPLNTTITFTVSQVANSWQPSPGMTGWQYKNFSSSNFIVGTPKYGDTVTYVLKGAPEGDITIIYDKDANGAITIDQTVFDELNALPAGSYIFTATVTGTLDYGDLVYQANVTVLKATNTWKYSPGMTSWSYKGFVDNFVAGTPTYGEATDVTYKVSGNGITEIVLGFVTEDGVRKLSSDTIAKLNALNVYGSYRLTAYLEGTSNYSDLDYDATFSVSEISNTWEITPGMTGWEYGEYAASSFRAGVPTLREDEDAVVTYTLYRVTKDSEGNDVDDKLAEFDASNLYNFADLAVGSYKLVAEYPKTNNYSKLSQPITFSVTSATNKWTTYPGMTGWAYLGYTSGNFRAGAVALTDATDEVITYTLYELIAGAGNTVKEEYMTQFTESSAYDFLHLGVGNYKIHALLKGTDNYPDLTYDFEFSVTAINNTWSTAPILTGWTYGQFAESNFRAAVPTHNEAYGEDSENNPLYRSVTYTLKSGDTVIDTVEFKFNADGTLHQDTVNALKKLSANAEGESYTLDIAFEGNRNYRDLDQSITFRVTTANNTWSTTPGMTGWVYGEYTSSSFRAGVPTLREDEAAKVTYTLYSVTKNEENGTETETRLGKFDASSLYDFTTLGVGSYKLLAEYPATNNYGALSQPITFSVTKAANRWTTNPGMTGWAYLGYVSSNFRAGVAALNDATEDDGITVAVVKYTLYSVKTDGDGKETETPIGNTFTASSLPDFNSLGAGRYKIYASLKGTANYDELTQTVEFTVSKTNNSWTATPGMTSWSYMAFTVEGNFTAGDPYLKEVATDKVVTYKITKADDPGFTAITFTDIETVKTKLEGLAVGSYTMTAIYPGTDNYNELVRESITFGVNKIQNTWATAPGLTGWVYEAFDMGNFTAGIPTLTESKNQDGSDADVVYTITKTGSTDNRIEFVELVKDDANYKKINALPSGNYILTVTYLGTDNYEALNTPVSFTVSQVANSWQPSPGMTGWQYKNFSSSNFIVGTPKYIGEDESVVYTLKNDADINITITYKVVDGVVVVDTTAFNALNALEVGKYTFTATVKGTTDYGDLEYEATVSVMKAANTWSQDPGMTSWSYKGYTAAGNFTEGIPTLRENSAAVVTYTITKVGDTGFTAITFTNIADVKTQLENLQVGSYIMTAIYPGTDNYDLLNRGNITFSVNKIQNTWATAPVLTGWVFGSFSSDHFTAGVPTLRDDATAKVVYTVTKLDGSTFTLDYDVNQETGAVTLTKASIDKLNALGRGNYSMAVTYPATDNYDPLNAPVSFTVSQVSNSWQPSPGMTGWQYKNFSSSNFIVGTPKYIGEDESVVYTLKNDAGININITCSVGEDGAIVIDDVAFNALNALPVGKYTFTATVEGTTDYGDLEYEATVSVMKAANTWSQDPGMTSWSYMAFTVEGNFTEGDPYLQEVSADKVTYKITKVGDNNFTEITFTNIADVKTQLENLQVGSYIMTATYPGTDNYDPLNRGNITFGVNKIQNTWETAPGLTGWVFESFDLGHFTAGIPTLQDSRDENDQAADVVYTVTKSGETEVVAEFVGIEKDDDTYVKLNALGRGNYVMTVTYLGTANYEPLDATITFTVSQVANSWQPSPGMTGWQYKNFFSSNFIVGTPKYGDTVTYVLKGAPDGDITITYEKDKDTGVVTIDETVFDKLNALPAGSYIFTATVDGTLNYGELVYEATVSVLTTSNTWATAPVLTGWVFGSFGADNFTAGVPTLRDDATAKVVYTVTKLDGSKLTLDYVVDQETGAVTLTKASIDALNALGRGNYTMTVTYPKTDNYSALNTPVTFTVSQVANSWTISPGMTGWQYKNFSSTNFIVGTPKYGTTVTYKLNETVITYDTVGEDGVVTIDTTVFGELNALPVGKYTFTATVEGTTDYAPLTYSATVTVMKAANTWERDPGMTSWSYKGYTAAGNFTEGIPTLRENSAVVTYTITKVGDTGFTAITFTNIADVKTGLEKLAVGSYTMTVSYPGTVNYDPLNRGNITFSVNKIQNTWATRPGLTGWVYESFNAANFTAGVPTLTESKNQDGSDAEVKYTITKDGDDTFTAITFTKLSDVQTKLEKLAVGSYTMTVSYPGTVNYDPLDPSITFTVSQRTNSWSETPRLSSYRYSQFAASSNFAAGEPYYPTDDKTIGYGIFTKNLATSALFTAENSGVKFNAVTDNITVSGKQMTVEDYLNTLSVGNYWFAAYVAGTNEYTELYTCTEFVVNQATNSWTSGKVPFISGWTYDEYADGLFTAGEATFGAVLYTVQMVDAAGNIITGENGIAKINNNKLENMTSDDLAAVLSQLGAGRYNLHASTGDTVNYTAATQDIRFSVAMADNSWKDDTPPTIEGWTYGSTPKQHSDASATVNTGAIVYTYYKATLIGGVWSRYGDSVTINRSTAAGDYVMVATVPANANYNELTHTAHFVIDKKANAWIAGYEPEDKLEWTWGAASLGNRKLVRASAEEISGGLAYVITNEAGTFTRTIEFEYNDGELPANYKDTLIAALVALGVDNYRITTKYYATANLSEISKTTVVTVSSATFEVTTSPKCDGWTWSDSDDKKVFTDIKVRPVLDTDVYTVNYTMNVKGATSVTPFGDDFGAMLNDLTGSGAGTYVVTITVSGANYTTLTRTVEVTIAKATNVWTENEPIARYDREYNNPDRDITVPQAVDKFGGTVEYQYESGAKLVDGSNNIIATAAQLSTYLNGLGATGTTPFVYYTVVAGTDNYTQLRVKTEVYVSGTQSSWKNTPKEKITLTYSKTLTADLESAVKPYIPEGYADKGTTKYTISYLNYNGEKPDGVDDDHALTSVDAVFDWLTTKGMAGTYVIYSYFTPGDSSFMPLPHTLTLTIDRARPKWGTIFNEEYIGTYGSIEVPDPTVTDFDAPITVTIRSAGQTFAIPSGKTFAEYVKILDAANYSVTFNVISDDNWFGLEPQYIMSLSIVPITNRWYDTEIDEETVIEWDNGYTWTYTRGETVSVKVPTAVTGNDTLEIILDGRSLSYKNEKDFNDFLAGDNMSAGRHTLIYSIARTVNYNAVMSNCTIVIEKTKNSWTTELESYVGKGSVDMDEFAVPVAKTHIFEYIGTEYDLLRFDIVRSDGSYSVLCADSEKFESEIAKFANGTYTVTAYVGGTGYREITAAYKEALDKYNEDNEALIATCTITLTPKDNAWGESKPTGGSWTWHEFDASMISRPTATHGSDTIVYTIKSNGKSDIVVKGNDGDEVFTEFLDELSKLDAGTYSVTVSIDGTDDYNAPDPFTVVYIVDPVTTAWDLTDKQLSDYEFISVYWGSLKESDFPEMTLKNPWTGTGSTIVYAVNGEDLEDNPSTSLINEASWLYFLSHSDAGRYTITATVAGDTNHTPLTFRATVTISPMTSKWNPATIANNGDGTDWVYGAAANVNPTEPVIGLTEAEIGDWDTTPTYTLTKKSQNGTLELYSGASWSALLGKLADQPGGEYTLTAHIDGDVNHTALDYTYTVTVSAAGNTWETHVIPDDYDSDEIYTIVWVHGIGGDVAIEYEAKYNNSKLVVTVNGDVVTDFDSLKYYNVGEYSIVATVAADDSYSGLTETIKLKITKAPNTWNSNIAIRGWTWDDINQVTGGWNIGFKAPIPAQGLSATVTVSSGATVVLEATINYTVSTGGIKTAIQNDVDALVRRLCALDVGNYTISITVGETDNYSALAGQTASFGIEKATNRWETGKAPMIEGWSIDGDTAYPSATPVFGKGTVVFSYTEAMEDESEPSATAVWVAAPAYAEGSYWLRATVEDTVNYSSLTGYYKFIIGAGKNAWVNNPGVTAWDWDNYDKDVNLFSGSARSNGKATFTVTKANGTEAGLSLKAEDFNPTDKTLTINAATIAKLEGFELDAAGKVSDDVAKLLKALKHGSYRLNVTVAAGSNLDSISGGANFTVGRAENTWANDAQSKPIAPSIRYYTYRDTDVFTAGVTTYGAAVSYRITSGTAYTSDVMDGDQLEEFLLDLPAGSYVLRAWATAADTADYRSLYSEDSPYQVVFVVSPKDNVFTIKPKTKISEYYANIHAEDFDLDAWLGRPQAEYGTGDEIYTILNTDYTPINNKTYTYEQFKKAVLADLGSGEYIVRITVEASTNYRELTEDVSLTISRRTNRFTVSPDKLTGQWKLGADGHNASELNPVTVTAEHGTVSFTLNNVTYDSFSKLAEAVKALDASSYQVTYSVEQTDEYAGLTKVVQLDIKQATNAWKDSWTIGSSLAVSSATKAGTTITWAWHSNVTWTNAVPTYGNTVYVEIKTKGASSSLRYITIDYSVANYADAIDTVCSALSGLDVGTYVMTVTAPAGSNWTQLSSSTEFSITPISNQWTSECTIIGAEKSGEIFTVEYGNTALPSATALYGTTVYSYRNAVTGESLDSMPIDAGTYTIVFEVPEPAAKNYGVLTKEVTLEILRANITSFIVSPGTTGWIWGDYNRLSNVFNGIPTSGGKVSYTILDKDGDVVTVEKVTVEQDGETKTVDVVLDGIVLGDISDKHYDDFDKDVYVSTLVGAAISKLKSGTYTLRINVAATDNNIDFKATTTFVVTAAENVWTTPPQVVSWVSNNWNADEYMPKAISRFGNPHIVIRSSVTDDVYFEANYNSVTGKLEIVGDNLLNRAPTGWYNMRATVAASENEYDNELDNTISFQIFAQGSPDEKNYWIDTPGIEPWAANIEDKINLPYGKPARGLPYFVFYKAEYNGTSYTRGDLVTEGELAHTVSKYDEETGVDKYYQDFYVPIAPGYYYMVACAVSVDINGNVVEKDNLDTDKTPMLFEIFNRDNSWEQDVRITSLLYLGERKDWAGPNAKAYLPDSEITYKYLDAETREDLGSEMPAKPGKYIVVASAKARFSATITSEIDFEVRYSKNYWVGDKSPTIENWSEEFSATSPDPVGEAMFGEVEYTYINKADPDTILTEKPTQEGEYTMIARVEIEGYETLESPYDFTITSAYDRTFVVIDIILGVTACSMAVVVFIFAVRRYKEN